MNSKQSKSVQKILGRKPEIATLEHAYQANSAQFIAIYGRRRIGKTFLIKQTFKNKKDCVFFNVTGSQDGNLSEQLHNFTTRISEVFYHGISLEKVTSWNNALDMLTKAISDIDPPKKIVLFFDELPWMASPKSRLLQNLDYYWNQYWSNMANVRLIVCGSSASWIIRNIINNTGGLHNRITAKIHLEPFNLYNTRTYLRHKDIKLDNNQTLLLYIVTGGVPYYLSKMQPGLSAMQLIEALAFSKNAFFVEEFDNLFASLFNNHETHIKIVKLLATNRDGIGKRKLLEAIGSAGGSTTNLLQELEDAGFIKSFTPIFHKKRGMYYRLTDAYTLFYLKWIEPIKHTLQRQALDKGDWQAMVSTPSWNSWLGYAFETVCYNHIIQIKQALNLPPLSFAGTWRYTPKKGSNQSGAQIDLLFDRRDGIIQVCEIKHTDNPFTITKDYAQKLEQKLRVFKTQTRTTKQLFISFVTTNGIQQNSYAAQMITSTITLNALFKDI